MMNREQERARMEELWSVDTNAELLALKARIEADGGSLTIKRIAELCLVSYDTAVSWMVRRDSPKWRRMPNSTLMLLEIILSAQPEQPSNPEGVSHDD